MSIRKWTQGDIERLRRNGVKVVGLNVNPSETAVNRPDIPSVEEPKALRHFKSVLGLMRVEFVTEHRFHPTRKFRFDIAIPDMKLAIEYEGMMQTSKSRHTTIGGFTNDCTKYNLAQLLGWKVLRYTAKNYEHFHADLMAAMESRGESWEQIFNICTGIPWVFKDKVKDTYYPPVKK